MLTKEQQEVVNIDFKDILLVNAYAGTGKTSTLIEFCKKRKEKKILYLAYNNSMVKEAEKKFKLLSNVSVKTLHSLAYAEYGIQNKERLGNLTSKDIQEYFDDENALFNASFTISLLKDFCNSADTMREFCEKILSEKIVLKNKKLDKEYLVHKLKELWKKITLKESKIAYPHDFYLKEYQLNKPKLDYDFILVDEAQDINECVIDIVLKQKAKKVFIGDTYQSIYAFRGAIDSLTKLSQLENSITLFLTQSFRCPLSIANIANFYLLALGSKKQFIGTKKEKQEKTNVLALLARNNATLFDYAVENLDKKIAKEIKKLSVNPKEAEFILTTGHKSKGLEWDSVEIMDDFINLRAIVSSAQESGKEVILAKEELNLLYVAITRSMQTLHLSEYYLLDLELIKTMKKCVVFE